VSESPTWRSATRAARHAAVSAWAVVALASCGGDGGPNDPTPQPQNPVVSAVAPPSGTTLGGTTVTITGRNFAAGATVSIGGVPAANVQVQGPTSLTADTAQRAAGPADVVVTVAGRSGSLPGGYTFVAPSPAANQPPVISGITSRGSRPNEPSNFADLDETITVTATAIDAETPADQLTYEWTAESGTISGTGRQVSWRAPAQASTPSEVRISLTVVETYQTVDAQGLPTTAQNRVPGSFTVRLHASAKEVRDLAVEFLLEFSQQRNSPQQIVRNFSDSCRGKAEELHDVAVNQDEKIINSYSVEANPPVDIDFGGVCRNRGRIGDACAYVPVRWQSTVKASGKPELAVGNDQVNAIYENSRWRLCDSDFIGTTTLDGKPSPRSFKH
jgi:hypothetical protein